MVKSAFIITYIVLVVIDRTWQNKVDFDVFEDVWGASEILQRHEIHLLQNKYAFYSIEFHSLNAKWAYSSN